MDAVPATRLVRRAACQAADRRTEPGVRRGARFTLLVVAVVIAVGVAASWWFRERPADLYRQGLAELDRGRFIRAEGRLDALRQFPGSERYQHVLEAGLLMRRGRYNEALGQLAMTAPTGDVRDHALLVAGECLYQLGCLDDATGVFGQLAGENPLNTASRRWLAAIDYDEGRLNEALRQLRELTALQPDDYSSHRLMGQIQQQDLHNPAAAVVHYRDALARRPPAQDRTLIAIELARALIEQGDHQAALDTLQKPEQDSLLLALQADCFWHIGDQDEALSRLARAFAAPGDKRDALMLQARMSVDEGQAEAAVAPLQRVLEADPHDFPCLYQLALVFSRLGDETAAEAHMTRMQQSREFRTQLAELFVRARRPDDAAVREQLAELCSKHDQPEMAAMWHQAAVESRNAGPVTRLGPEWYSPRNKQ